MRDFRREVSAASDFSTEFPETEFSWSLTRHLRFLRCERAYFLHYYAAQGGWDGWADPVISAIYRGKKAKLYAEWLGELMDAAWKAVLDRVRFIPEPMRARAFRRRLEEHLFARMTERVREAAESPDYIPFPDFELPPDDLFRKARHDLAEALEFAFSTQYPSAILHFQRPNRINRTGMRIMKPGLAKSASGATRAFSGASPECAVHSVFPSASRNRRFSRRARIFSHGTSVPCFMKRTPAAHFLRRSAGSGRVSSIPATPTAQKS